MVRNSTLRLSNLRVIQNYRVDTKVMIKVVFNILLSVLSFGGILYLLMQYIIPYFNMDLISKACITVKNSEIACSVNKYFEIIVPKVERITTLLPSIDYIFAIKCIRIMVITSFISMLVFLIINTINSIMCFIKKLSNEQSRYICITSFVVSDILSAISSYISLGIFSLTSCSISALLPIVFFNFGAKIHFYIAIWLVSLVSFIVVFVKFIEIKKRRIESLSNLRENIITYCVGVVLMTLPIITSMIILAAITIILLLIIFIIVIYIAKGLAFGK